MYNSSSIRIFADHFERQKPLLRLMCVTGHWSTVTLAPTLYTRKNVTSFCYVLPPHLWLWSRTAFSRLSRDGFFVPRNFIRRKKSMRISTKVSTEVSVKLSRQRFFTYQITAVDSFRRGVYTYVSMYIVTCLPTSSSKVSSMFDSYRNTCSLFGKTETAWPTLLCQLRLQE